MYRNHKKEILDTINTVFSHGKVLMGPEIKEFEKRIATYCKREYAVAVGSCTDALYFSLKSCGINHGDEVLVTSFSFIASATPILRIGATPVFVDIEPDYYMMNLVDLENKITKRTKAIIAVQLFGQTLPINKVEEIAMKNDLILIEDAAQSLGATYKDRSAGSMGLASCFSFDPTKIIGAFGNGGVILTDDEILCERAKKLNYHGKNLKSGEFESLGFNSRLATSQAALLNLQFEWLGEWIRRRNEIAALYKQELRRISEIELPNIREGCNHIFHKFVIRTKERDKLKKFLSEKGINTKIHYNKAIYEYEVFKNQKCISNNLHIVNQIKQKVLSLPIYPEITNNEIIFICSKIKDFF